MATTRTTDQNRVLSGEYKVSRNFFDSDRIFQHLLEQELSANALEEIRERLQWTGEQAAGPMNDLSLQADKQAPTLEKRNWLGEHIDRIRFHPAYKELTDIAVKTGMFSLKWEPSMRQRFRTERHRVGFAPGFLFAMSENGLYCPLCMTDGVARLIDRYADEADKERLLPRIYTEDPDKLYTGAMFLTEKTGGSDVGANIVSADQQAGDRYLLNGEKWFCSNANADLIFALGRSDEDTPGTRGLSIFLVEKTLADGRPNPMNIVRLKDKLGVRSMASAEIELSDTVGKRVGEEGQGFKIMTDMINLSRLYNAVTAVADTRRGIIEAYQFQRARYSFGKKAIRHPLVRDKFHELGSRYLADLYLCWRTIRALDLSDTGDEKEGHLSRLLTPMLKKCTAENVIYSVRESMELMGGIGYIEDGVMPKIMRDCMVLPIWEGTSNIMVLDMLRASARSNGLKVLYEETAAIFAQQGEAGEHYQQELDRLFKLVREFGDAEQEMVESTAKPVFERLTQLYQLALVLERRDDESKAWIDPASRYLSEVLFPSGPGMQTPLDEKELEGLIGWSV